MKRIFILFLFFITTCAYCSEKVYIVKSPQAVPRVCFGIDRLSIALKNAGYKVAVSEAAKLPKGRPLIIIGTQKKSPLIDSFIQTETASEGFVLESKKAVTVVAGGDDSGTLYGCMELADRIKKAGNLPKNYHFADKPAMVLRGTCIGMQKTQLLPRLKMENRLTTYGHKYLQNMKKNWKISNTKPFYPMKSDLMCLQCP
jgi:hypothetical protein